MGPQRSPLLLARLVLVCVLLAAATRHAAMAAGPAPDPEAVAQAQRILKATGVTGGLVVHIACGDGSLTAALRAGDGYLVQGLDTSAESVAKARKYLSVCSRSSWCSVASPPRGITCMVLRVADLMLRTCFLYSAKVCPSSGNT